MAPSVLPMLCLLLNYKTYSIRSGARIPYLAKNDCPENGYMVMFAGRIWAARWRWDIPNGIDQSTFPIFQLMNHCSSWTIAAHEPLQLMNHFSCYNYHESITFIRRTWSTTCAGNSTEDGSRVSREQRRFSEHTRKVANNMRAMNPNLMTTIADGPGAKEATKGKEMADTKISTGDVSHRRLLSLRCLHSRDNLNFIFFFGIKVGTNQTRP